MFLLTNSVQILVYFAYIEVINKNIWKSVS